MYYVHRDALNSVVALTDDSGLVQTYTYDAWGGYSTQVNTGAAISRFLYTSRESDSETGMYYYRSRNYWPQYGRFIQLDPIDFRGRDMNFYRYVVNNPVNFIDPYGTDYMVSTIFGHAYGTVWDNQGNRTTFDFSPSGWRESSGGAGPLALPILYHQTTSEQDRQLISSFEQKVKDQPGGYNPLTNNCWQALGDVANPILDPPADPDKRNDTNYDPSKDRNKIDSDCDGIPDYQDATPNGLPPAGSPIL